MLGADRRDEDMRLGQRWSSAPRTGGAAPCVRSPTAAIVGLIALGCPFAFLPTEAPDRLREAPSPDLSRHLPLLASGTNGNLLSWENPLPLVETRNVGRSHGPGRRSGFSLRVTSSTHSTEKAGNESPERRRPRHGGSVTSHAQSKSPVTAACRRGGDGNCNQDQTRRKL